MQLKTLEKGTTLIAAVSGEIDHHQCPFLRQRIDMKLKSGIYNKLIFDLSAVTFTDSSVIALIMGRYKYMAALKGSAEVITSDEKIRKILTMSGLDRYVKIMSSQKLTRREG